MFLQSKIDDPLSIINDLYILIKVIISALYNDKPFADLLNNL
jgi:hypothetical protein